MGIASYKLDKTSYICFHFKEAQATKYIWDMMWRGAEFYEVEAKVSYNHSAVEVGVGSGRLCTPVSPKIAHLIKDVDYDHGGHA